MDPATERIFKPSPRDLDHDAFFRDDRSNKPVSRTVELQNLRTKVMSTVAIPGFETRRVLGEFAAVNPLRHAQRTSDDGKQDLRGWTHNASYTHVLSRSATALTATTRLRVSLLFGTGTEATRHGVAAVAEAAPLPTLLIIVSGIEEGNPVTFNSPNRGEPPVDVTASTMWGVGITKATIEAIITARIGRLIPYDIVIAAAFSTGHYGLGGSINAKLFPQDKLERLVIYDCLYRDLMQPLGAMKTLRGKNLEIVAYVVTGGGNDFKDEKHPSFATLALGGNQTWNYINLFFNTTYRAITSARVIDEGRTPDNPIITTLPAAYETKLNTLVRWLPPRNTVVSDWNVYRKLRGSPPPASVSLSSLAANGKKAIGDFFREHDTTSQCLKNGWLLGWATKIGEDWHDLLLIEFGWEYLT